jgi:hypothetical protein
MLSIRVPPKKRGRPATGRDPVTAIRLSKEMRDAIDAYTADMPEPVSRSEAIRMMITKFLRSKGYLPK